MAGIIDRVLSSCPVPSTAELPQMISLNFIAILGVLPLQVGKSRLREKSSPKGAQMLSDKAGWGLDLTSCLKVCALNA